MLTKEHPKQGGPRDHRREKALHRAVTAPFACPAGDAQHGDPSCHHQHGQRNPAALAQGRCRHMGLEAVEKCYNIDHRCAPLWCGSCRLIQRNSTRQRATLPHFWRRYCYEDRFLESWVGSIITNPTTAIVELVANCWDAYATEVKINWPDPTAQKQFSISDDGQGMTREEFQYGAPGVFVIMSCWA